MAWRKIQAATGHPVKQYRKDTITKTVSPSHRRVLDAAIELEASGVRVSVYSISTHTGMQPGTVNYAVRDLMTEGLLNRLDVGVYRVAPRNPEPPKVSKPEEKETFIRKIPDSRKMARR